MTYNKLVNINQKQNRSRLTNKPAAPTGRREVGGRWEPQGCIGIAGASVAKNPPANAGDTGSIPGSGRSPGEGNGNPLQYSSWRIPWTEETGRLPSMGSLKSPT